MSEQMTSQDQQNVFLPKAKTEFQMESISQDTARRKDNTMSAESVFRANTPLAPMEEEKTLVIDIQALLYCLIEKWYYIIGAALALAIVVAIAVMWLIRPAYQATSKLYVLNSSDSAVNLSDLQIGAYLTKDYQEVFTNWEIHQQVIDNLGLEYTYEELEDMLSIENPTDTRILYISVTSGDAQEATDIANEYANVARTFIGRTMKTEEPMVMSVALKPVKPVSPKKTLSVMIAFILGALISAGYFAVRFIMDDKIKTAEDIQKYGDMTTLAVIPAHESDTNDAKGKVYGRRRGDHR